ncbi:hypothetical protein M5K25_005688 [Dendrobium thyrsiflorum]|uniref:Uncharacterized protein n=1 Tax=Dendrobium thyrsiflorum TaxID=117978 RepID=A0ABD0VJA2_DENTH
MLLSFSLLHSRRIGARLLTHSHPFMIFLSPLSAPRLITSLSKALDLEYFMGFLFLGIDACMLWGYWRIDYYYNNKV